MTTKQTILNLLANGVPLYKGRIEDILRQSDNHPMGDTTARTLRLLVNEKKIMKLKDADGNTMYKITPINWDKRSEATKKAPTFSMFPDFRSSRSMGDYRNF